MGMPGTTELIIILVIVVLLFGAKKIPDLAQGVGKGIKNFKKAMKEDEEKPVAAETPEKIEKDATVAKTEAAPEEKTKA